MSRKLHVCWGGAPPMCIAQEELQMMIKEMSAGDQGVDLETFLSISELTQWY